jgi:hypothetical protein
MEFNAARAVWRHAGSVGTEPQPPQWPMEVRQTYIVDAIVRALVTFDKLVNDFRSPVGHAEYDARRLDHNIQMMSLMLASMGNSLDRLREQLDGNSTLADDDSSLDDEPGDVDKGDELEKKPPTQQTKPIVDELVTVEQMAKLAGISVGALNNRLSKNRPEIKPIRPGGRNFNAYPWPEIRRWMMLYWPGRALPEDFREIQEKLRELS